MLLLGTLSWVLIVVAVVVLVVAVVMKIKG